jgi:DNA-binding MarR family transcriptional regulator
MPKKTEVLNELRGVMLAAERYRHVLAEHFGLGVTEAQAVSHLANHSELGQTELASMLGITTGATTALIDRLEAAGTAHRKAHPTDRRRSVVVLSEQGAAMVKEGAVLMGRVFKGMELQNIEILAATLATLRANIEDHIDELTRIEEDSQAS